MTSSTDVHGSAPCGCTPERLAILTVGLGTAVAMWAVGYVCRLPPAVVPSWAMLVMMVALLFVGGLTIGRHTAAGMKGGAFAGLLAGIINLLIVGSVTTSAASGEPNDLVPSALLWIPGALLVSVVLMALGALIQQKSPGRQYIFETWRLALIVITFIATLLVIVAGGIVTGAEEGMAVPDWPNTFGSNMFLFPLSKMTGGVYYEHAHRLYGTLVGLATIFTALALFRSAPAMRRHAILLVVLVVAQGLLGAFRVLHDNLILAMVHGVVAQIFLVGLALAWLKMTQTWRDGVPVVRAGAKKDKRLTSLLAGAVLLQLIFGALYRHMFTIEQRMPWPAHLHLTMAAVVAVLAVMVGLRVWARYTGHGLLRRLAIALLILIVLQLLLGTVALVAVFMQETPDAFNIIATTAHQANGALVFAVAAVLEMSMKRFAVDEAA